MRCDLRCLPFRLIPILLGPTNLQINLKLVSFFEFEGLRHTTRTHDGFIDLNQFPDPMLGALGSHLLFSHDAIDAEEFSSYHQNIE